MSSSNISNHKRTKMLKPSTLFLFLQFLSIGIQMARASSGYAETGECQGEQICLYRYSSEQNYHADTQQNMTVSTTVEVTCHSVGQFRGNAATQYCMQVSGTEMQGNIFNDSKESKKYRQIFVDHVLSGWFCFVQTDDGKVVAVQHASNELDDSINLKKSIAAAFQANFKGTEDEKEVDPQSDHIAHYRYKEEPNGVKKMHRNIESEDVIEYSTGAKKKDFKLERNEDIEYQDGKLYHSSGDTDIKVKGKDEQNGDQMSLSKAFSAHGSFSLDLEKCYSPPQRARVRQRRSLSKMINQDMTEEGLKAHLNTTMNAQKRMADIRKRLPSINDILKQLHKYPENTKLYNQLEILLKLEHDYQALPEFSPAQQDVVNYLKKIEHSHSTDDVKMREVIYTLLSREGSLQSQMVLLEALQHATDKQEVDNLAVLISMVRNPHMELISALKERLLDESLKTEGLLLAFGALAANAQPEIEYEVSKFLLESVQNLTPSAKNNSHFATLLLAMGNTGSKYVVKTILDHIDYPLEGIKVAAIRACLKFTHMSQVQDQLKEVLITDPEEEVVVMVVHTLVKGYRYCKDEEIDTSSIAHHPMLSTLVLAVQRLNNTDLLELTSAYLLEIGGENALNLMSPLYIRQRRGSDWDASRSEYDLVASRTSRQSDEVTYPNHRAYIYGKTLGIDEANLKAAAGVFMGFSSDFENIKGFGKIYAESNVLWRQKTLANIEVLLQKNGVNIRGKVYVEMGGSVFVNNETSVTTCYNYDRNLRQNRYNLFSFTYEQFVYVTTIEFEVALYLEITVDVDAEVCAGASLNELATVTAGIAPRITLSIEGSVSASLLDVARGGITASANIAYQPEPRVSGKVCNLPNYQTCAGLYESWPGNTLEIYAWYQVRRIEWCWSWWVPYPCGFDYGDRHRVDAFDWSWTLSSSSLRAISEVCYPSSSSCSASPLDK